MVYSNQLQRNTGIVDPLIFSEELADSYFWYHGYSTVKNHFVVRQDIEPDRVATWGGKSVFKFPIIADKLGPVQLMFDLPPNLAVVGGGGSPRYVDFIGFVAWEKIKFLYSTGELYELTSEEIFDKYTKLHGTEAQDSIKELVAGGLSDAARAVLAATVTQQIIVDLPLPFTRATGRWLELMQLAHEPRIEVTWRRLDEVIHGDGGITPTSTIENIRLRKTIIHLDGDERDALTARTESEDGIIRLFDEVKLEKFTIPAGPAAVHRLKLNNFRSSSKRLAFMIRHVEDLTAPNAHNYFGNFFTGLLRFWFEAADGKIINEVEDRYDRYYLHSLYHPSPAGQYIYEWSFAIAPDDLLNATGSYNFGNTTNPTLVLDLGVIADDIEVCVLVNEYNTMQHVRGDLIVNFK